MPRIQPIEPENAPDAAQPLIEAGKKQTGGQVINFFKQLSVSPATFKAYMDFAGTMQEGALDRQMQELIAVAVSDFDGCKY
jgi:alkylhydroperoxidase family enzyme